MSKVSIALSILLVAVLTAGAVTYWQYSVVKKELIETQKNTVKVSDFARLSDQLSRVTAQRADAERAITDLKREIDTLRDYPEKLASLEKRFAGLQEALKKKSASLEQKDRSISKLKQEHEKALSALSSQIEKLQDKNARDQATIVNLKQKRSGMRKEIDILRDYPERLASLEKRFAGLQEALKKKSASLEQKDRSISKLKQEHEKALSALSSQIEELQGRNERHQTTIAALKPKLSQMRKKIDTLKKDQGNIAALEKQLARLKKDQQRKEKSIKLLKSTYDNLLLDLKKEIEEKEITVSQFEERLKISLVNRILFAEGSCEITPKGKKVLKQVAQSLKKVKDKHIFVVGHTDNLPIGDNLREKFPSNWELSAARAGAVVRFLSQEGEIDPDVFVTVGCSFYQSVQSNETPEGRAQNRRAEIIVGNSLGLEQGSKKF